MVGRGIGGILIFIAANARLSATDRGICSAAALATSRNNRGRTIDGADYLMRSRRGGLRRRHKHKMNLRRY